jgi:DNA-binding NarL/FixJ family response regulator
MIKVLIVENEGLLRDMLKISLSSIPNLKVVGAVSDGAGAISAAGRLVPDVILMDIDLGSEPNGITAGLAIKQEHSDIGIMLLSAHDEREYLELISKEDFSGWSYLLKQSVNDSGTLARAIEGVASGLVVMDQNVVNGMRPRRDSLSGKLTPRQQDVLAMMAQGYNNVSIAEKLFLGTKSVENYTNTIYQELGLTDNGQLHRRVQAVLSYIKDSV